MPFFLARAGLSGVQDLGDLAVRAAIPTAQSFSRLKSSPIASRQRRVLLPTQVAERVRTDARVALLERTNLRYLEPGQVPGGAPVDLVTLDLSFISVLKVLPAVCGVLAPRGALLVLIKPQFEAGREQVRRTMGWCFEARGRVACFWCSARRTLRPAERSSRVMANRSGHAGALC